MQCFKLQMKLKVIPDKVLEAPHTTIIDRLDETTATRKPILKFEDLHQEKL